jgi:hypothetical protein
LKVKRITLPMNLYRLIENRAWKNDRSVNKEITAMLKERTDK